MYHAGGRRDADRLAQKGSLLGVSLDQVDGRTWRLRQCASQDHAGKAATTAKVDPDFCGGGQREKLQRVGDVPGPQMRERRWSDQIGLRLPFPEQLEIAVKPRFCFT